jgi:hypothetical protein
MYSLIDAGGRQPGVREYALGVLGRAGVKDRDTAGAIKAIFNDVQSSFRFVHDPHGKELVGDAPYLLQTKAGDCDDYAVVIGSLLSSIGIPARISTLRADPHEPGRFSHVYPEASNRGQWVAMDATQRESFPGWEPPKHNGKRIWPVPRAMARFKGMGDFPMPPMTVDQIHQNIANLWAQTGGTITQDQKEAVMRSIARTQGMGVYSPQSIRHHIARLRQSGQSVSPQQIQAIHQAIAATREAQGLSDVSTDIASIANAIGPQAADIIAASRNPIPGYVPTPGVNPNAYQTATGLTLPGGSTFSLQSLGTVGTLVLLAAAIGFVVFMLRPRR